MRLNTRNAIMIAVFFIFAIALFSCSRPNLTIPAPLEREKEPLVLKSYEVPEGYGDEVKRIINDLLIDRVAEKRYGQVTMAPDGQLLVNAPKSFHPGVENFLDTLKKKGPLPPEPSIRMHYWIVLGMQTSGMSNAGQFKEIAPALESINESQGTHEFVLLEHLSTLSKSNHQAQVTGATAEISCLSSIRNDQVLMDMWIRSESSRLDTEVQIPAGKLLVLGQSAIEPKRPYALLEEFSSQSRAAKQSEKVLFNIFYIVRADIIG